MADHFSSIMSAISIATATAPISELIENIQLLILTEGNEENEGCSNFTFSIPIADQLETRTSRIYALMKLRLRSNDHT
jgi:hypothetical protein